MRAKFLGRFRGAMRRDIRGGRAKYASVIGKYPAFEAAVFRNGIAQCQIEAALDQIKLSVGKAQVERQPGICGKKSRQRGDDILLRKCARGRKSQRPADLDIPFAEGGQRGFLLLQDLTREGKKILAFGRQRDFSRRAVQQIGANLVLKFCQFGAGHSGSHAQLSPCCTYVQHFAGQHEQPQTLCVHVYVQNPNSDFTFRPFICFLQVIYPAQHRIRAILDRWAYQGRLGVTRFATVNYHVHKPERQAFHLDAGGVAGNLISPQLAPTRVRISDARRPQAGVVFAKDSVEFARSPTAVAKFDESGDWQAGYDAELTKLLTQTLGAEEVVVFDHTIRVDDATAARKPARNVHSDYSQNGAETRLIDLLGDARAQSWSDGHFAFVNVWRPVEHPINSAPLGFVRPSSVAPEDWLLLDLIYPDRTGQIMGLVGNTRHDWVYQSLMTPDEVAIFNIYDNRGQPSIAHSALDMVEDPTVNTPRKSIESRTLVRYGAGS